MSGCLPAGTIVRFREPTAWDKYWREICVGIAVVLFQAALIASLLIERRSRHRTTLALEESQKHMNLAAHAARLSTWIWDTTRRQAPRHCAETTTRKPLGEPPIRSTKFFGSAHPADREGLEQAVEKAVASGDELDIEYRVLDARATCAGLRPAGGRKRSTPGACWASRWTSRSARPRICGRPRIAQRCAT